MYPISPAVQSLIKILRGTDMPWVGDEIEAHLRLGKVELFRRGVDDTEAGMERLRQRIEDAEGQSKPYSKEEQVEEALKVLREQIEGRVNLTDDATKSLSQVFGLSKLAVTDGEGQLRPFFSDSARAAARGLSERLPEIRQWLVDGAADLLED